MDNFVCALNMEKIPIASVRADDNGAYTKRLNASRYYSFKNGSCNTVHRDLNDKYYINYRDTSAAISKPVYVHNYVDFSTVYTLTRYYWYSKYNNFYNMIAKIKCMDNRISSVKRYLYLDRWIGPEAEQFYVERHRNATKAHAGAYFKKYPAVLREVRNLLQDGVSPDEVYVTVSKKNNIASSVSEMLNNPKVVHNAKSQMQPLDEDREKQMTDVECLIDLAHDKSFVRSVRFDGECYSSFNCTPQMLIDMHRFVCWAI